MDIIKTINTIFIIESIVLIIGLYACSLLPTSSYNFGLYSFILGVLCVIYSIIMGFYMIIFNGTNVNRVAAGCLITLIIPFVMTVCITLIGPIVLIFENTVGYNCLYYLGKYTHDDNSIETVSEIMDKYLTFDTCRGLKTSMMFLFTKLSGNINTENVRNTLKSLNISILTDQTNNIDIPNFIVKMVNIKNNIGIYCWFCISFILSTYLCIKYMMDYISQPPTPTTLPPIPPPKPV